MGLADVVICGLAGWRLANLIVHERGPWSMLTRIRQVAGIDHLDDVPTDHGGSELGRLLYCVWCMSPWTAVAMAGLWQLGDVGRAPVIILAIAGVILMADRFRNDA